MVMLAVERERERLSKDELVFKLQLRSSVVLKMVTVPEVKNKLLAFLAKILTGNA